MGILQINILGTSFAIQSKEDDSYLNKIRDYYSSICNEIQSKDNLQDQKKVAVLAGILIADELFKEKEKGRGFQRKIAQGQDSETERITLEMIEKIEQALK